LLNKSCLQLYQRAVKAIDLLEAIESNPAKETMAVVTGKK
jgi:hypothetical protein